MVRLDRWQSVSLVAVRAWTALTKRKKTKEKGGECRERLSQRKKREVWREREYNNINKKRETE